MARSIWNGTITFGLIAVPIKVNSATEDKSVHFHQVHAEDGSPDQAEADLLQGEQGGPLQAGRQGLRAPRRQVRDARARTRSTPPRASSSHLIELEEFVRAAEIDPVFYDRTYYLGAGKDGGDAYRLLHDALRKSRPRRRSGRWVFHNREYLVAIRPLDGVLALHTMRFADELVDPGDLDIPKPSAGPAKREIEMAGKLVDSLHERFDPDAFHDSYRERVLELIETKASGKEPELPEIEASRTSTDLAAALEASLAAGK